MWIVIYAKMIDCKDMGIKLSGVHFGGVADDKLQAEVIARDCINTIKGGTIMPKLFEMNGRYQLPRIMEEATVTFRKKEEQMITAAVIISRNLKHK